MAALPERSADSDLHAAVRAHNQTVPTTVAHLTNVLKQASARVDELAGREGLTAIQLAIHLEKPHVAIQLVKHAKPRKLTLRKGEAQGWTALHFAVYYGYQDVTEAIIEADPDQNLDQIGDMGGTIPLHIAARVGNDVAVRYMLEETTSINRADKQGFTALQQAANLYQVQSQRHVQPLSVDEAIVQARRETVFQLLLNKGATLTTLDGPQKALVLRELGIKPIHTDDEAVRHIASSVSLVATLLAGVAYTGWASPPGSFLNGLTMLDGGGRDQCAAYADAQDAAAAGAAALAETAEECGRYQWALLAFFVANSCAFTFSIASVLAAAAAGTPPIVTGLILRARVNRWRLRCTVTLLSVALASGLLSFVFAAFAVLPRDAWRITAGVATGLVCLLIVSVVMTWGGPWPLKEGG